MTKTTQRKQRDRIREAIEPVMNPLYDQYEFDGEFRVLYTTALIEVILPLMPGYMRPEISDLLGYNDPVLNAKLAKEDEMRDRIEATLKTKPTGSPEWTKVVKVLIKAEDEKGWDIERFWAWNEHEDQKFEKLRFGDLVKKPVLIISWLQKAFENDTTSAAAAPEYDEFGRMK